MASVFRFSLHHSEYGRVEFYKSDEDGSTIISPKIKKETNKADSLEFMVLPMNPAYDMFEKKKTYIHVKRNDKYLFVGRVSDVKTDIFMQRTVTCEGDLAYLADSVQQPNKKTTTEKNTSTKKETRPILYITRNASGDESSSRSKDTIKMSVENYFRKLITNHNSQIQDSQKRFTVGAITVDDSLDIEEFERTSFQDTSSVISSDLLSVYGGIIRTRFENGRAYIDWLEDYRNFPNNQEITFGVNLMEMDQEPPNDKPWSVLLPIGDDNLNISSVNSGSKFLVHEEAEAKYGYIVHYHKFDGVKSASKLLSKARRYLRTHARVYKDNLVIKAVDLELLHESSEGIDALELGTRIRVVSAPHGMIREMDCIAMELDIQNPENNSYTIGHILPPDKEKKKNSLSTKHAEAQRSAARTSGRASSAIDTLGGDVDANSNNINVNAENIAVNALNIAVNAENIAVVAKNISIAAETIDVKAQELTATFEDEAGGLSNKIDITAEGLKADLSDAKSGLTTSISVKAGEISTAISNAEGTLSSKITQTESSLTSMFNKKIYGPNEDGKGGIVADYTSKITQTAESINTEVSKKVGKDEVISRINQTAESITIQASKIDLSGYVTASQLATTNANITNLASGATTASKIVATNLKAVTKFEIGDSNNAASLYYRGSQFYNLTMSMPGTPAAASVIGSSYYNGAYQTSLSLAHSHSVSTGSDGTITIGGSVATNASGRSFKIADTKAYKDGVSAARTEGVNSVTVGSPYKWTSDSYNSSTHDTTVYVRCKASNDKYGDATLTVSGDSAYSAGRSSVSISSIYQRDDPYYNSGYRQYTVYIGVEATNDAYDWQNFYVDAQDAYDDGRKSVTISSIYQRDTASYQSSSCQYAVYVGASTSGGSEDWQNFWISAVDAYVDGQNHFKTSDVNVTHVSVLGNGTATVTVKNNTTGQTSSITCYSVSK